MDFQRISRSISYGCSTWDFCATRGNRVVSQLISTDWCINELLE
jgi:hypothetical protein